MRVKFIGHGKLLLTDFDGVRYAFYKDTPVEISQEIYNNMRDSGHIDMQDLAICEEKLAEAKKETVVEKIKEVIKPKAKHGHKSSRK